MDRIQTRKIDRRSTSESSVNCYLSWARWTGIWRQFLGTIFTWIIRVKAYPIQSNTGSESWAHVCLQGHTQPLIFLARQKQWTLLLLVGSQDAGSGGLGYVTLSWGPPPHLSDAMGRLPGPWHFPLSDWTLAFSGMKSALNFKKRYIIRNIINNVEHY